MVLLVVAVAVVASVLVAVAEVLVAATAVVVVIVVGASLERCLRHGGPVPFLLHADVRCGGDRLRSLLHRRASGLMKEACCRLALYGYNKKSISSSKSNSLDNTTTTTTMTAVAVTTSTNHCYQKHYYLLP